MSHTAQSLWALAWPDVPWEDASDEDKRLYADHADSLNRWEESR